MSAHHHPPFEEVESSRPGFEVGNQFEITKKPQPDWKPGQGLSNAPFPNREFFDPKSGKAKYEKINPDEVKELGYLYKLMIGCVTPRPVGFVSTIGEDGSYNLAPFSYFNVVGHLPPIVSLAISAPQNKEGKDTAVNILKCKEFVINIISEPFIEAANYTSIDAPSGVSEWKLSGLTQVKSETVKPPRVGESAFSMECELDQYIDWNHPRDPSKKSQTLILGRVKLFHVRSDLLIPDGGGAIYPERLQAISRLGGITYGRTTTGYEIPRPIWKDVKDTDEVKAALAKEERC